MPFERGRSKTGGRKAGVQNKRKSHERALDRGVRMRALKKGTTPLDVLMLAMMGGSKGEKLTERQIKVASDLAPYMHAKLAPQPAPMPTEQQKTQIIIEGGLPDDADLGITANPSPRPDPSVQEPPGEPLPRVTLREEVGQDQVGGDTGSGQSDQGKVGGVLRPGVPVH